MQVIVDLIDRCSQQLQLQIALFFVLLGLLAFDHILALVTLVIVYFSAKSRGMVNTDRICDQLRAVEEAVKNLKRRQP
jgi:hypothetical protein